MAAESTETYDTCIQASPEIDPERKNSEQLVYRCHRFDYFDEALGIDTCS